MSKYSKDWLKESELKTILEFQDIPEMYDSWILLMYYPALRISEAINVRVKDLNFENRCIDVWGGKGKDITELQKAPCKVQVLKRIKRYCDHNDLRSNDYIMFSQKGKQVTR
ncbi:MAG: site-specific integrase [Bacteroidales bacterium]|nr:site-specific integrase [Bacteroidales bacterium]